MRGLTKMDQMLTAGRRRKGQVESTQQRRGRRTGRQCNGGWGLT